MPTFAFPSAVEPPAPCIRGRGRPFVGPAPVLAVALGLALSVGMAACTGEAPPPAGGAEEGATGANLILMGTTDVHGWLLPWDYDAGTSTDEALSLLAPLVDSIRAAHPGRTLLVDSGDLLQGSALAAAFTPLPEGDEHPVITAMNLLEYDAAALGNHEFNFGLDHLDRVLAHARFPFLSANVVHPETGDPVFPPYTLVDRELDGGTVRIGITAVLPPGVAVWDRDHVEGRLHFPDMVEQLQQVVPRMREEGAHVVVVAAHSSFEGTSYDMEATGLAAENRMADAARLVPGIDVVFLGHSHREVADSTLNDVLFVQAGARASSLAVATLHLTRTEGGWEVTSKGGELLRPTPGRSWAALEEALQGAHERALARVNRVLGTSPVPWPAGRSRVEDGPLVDFVNEVQRKVSGAELSAAAVFSLEAGLPAGEITVAHLARLYPYDNNLLRAVRITGEELRAYLEHSARFFLPCPEGACEALVNPEWPGYNFDMVSGVDYTLDLREPVGSRVVQLDFQGTPVRPEQSFTLALNNYRQGGGGGFPAVTGAPVVYEGGESIRDLLIREVEERGVLRPEAYHRANWRILPEAWHERILQEMQGRR